MKAAVLYQYGGPEAFQYEDVPDPVPAPGQVLIKVAAASINQVDIVQRSGAAKDYFPLQFPAIIGRDCSGTVVKLGDGVGGLGIGERVAATGNRTYAELVVGRADLFARVPDGVDLIDAAAVPLVGETGSELISMASDAKAGNRVLVSGAAGGVGRAAVYAAKNLDAHVVAGVLKHQVDEARSIGADETVALDDAAAFAALPPVDIVANTLRGTPAAMLMGKIKSGGTFASVTGPPDNASEYPQVRVVPFQIKADGLLLAVLLEAVRDKKLTIPIARRMPLREAGAAQAAVAGGGLDGKVLLIP